MSSVVRWVRSPVSGLRLRAGRVQRVAAARRVELRHHPDGGLEPEDRAAGHADRLDVSGIRAEHRRYAAAYVRRHRGEPIEHEDGAARLFLLVAGDADPKVWKS
jgi:hypothetical protein